jgi:hypothetical protein
MQTAKIDVIVHPGDVLNGQMLKVSTYLPPTFYDLIQDRSLDGMYILGVIQPTKGTSNVYTGEDCDFQIGVTGSVKEYESLHHAFQRELGEEVGIGMKTTKFKVMGKWATVVGRGVQRSDQSVRNIEKDKDWKAKGPKKVGVLPVFDAVEKQRMYDHRTHRIIYTREEEIISGISLNDSVQAIGFISVNEARKITNEYRH